MNKMFGITELTEEHSNRVPGFNVRLGWKDGKPVINSEFNNSKYGGRDSALAAAVDFRNKELKKLIQAGEWPVDRTHSKPGKRNKSGTVGVHRRKQWGKVNGKSCPSDDIYVWVGTWVKDGVAGAAQFSERKWGEQEAYEMACAARKAKMNPWAGA